MTMTVLAASVRCSRSVISKVETGFLLPSLPMLQRLARALDADIAALQGDRPARERR